MNFTQRGVILKKISANKDLVLLTIAGSALLLWSGFYNRYPLLGPDSGGDILKSSSQYRSIIYDFFVHITSLRISLWPTVIVQSLITAFLLVRIPFVLLKDNPKKTVISFAILLGVISLTTISKFVSTISPDICASWLFLGALLFLISTRELDRRAAGTAVFLSVGSHPSHILIAIAFVPAIAIIAFASMKRWRELTTRLGRVAKAILASFLLIYAINYYSGLGIILFPPQKGNMLLSELARNGALSRTLDEYCGKKGWAMCAYKDDLKKSVGAPLEWFRWHNGSPFVSHKLFNKPRETDEAITLTIRHQAGLFARESFARTLRVLASCESIENRWIFTKTNTPAIRLRYPRELNAYLQSEQLKTGYTRTRIFPIDQKLIQVALFTFCISLALFYLFKKEYRLFTFITGTFLFLVVNALVAASAFCESGTYNVRVIWLVPYILFLTTALYFNKRSEA